MNEDANSIIVKEPLRILIVEDTPHHIEDVKAEMNKRIQAGIPLEVYYANNLFNALEIKSNNRLDGIISDIFFPTGSILNNEITTFLRNYGSDQDIPASGLYLAEISPQKDLPIALCTDAHHHAEKMHKVYDFVRKYDVPFVPNFEYDYETISQHKYWACAYSRMLDGIARKFAEYSQPTGRDEPHPRPTRENKENYNAFVKKYTLPEDFNPPEDEPDRISLEDLEEQ